MNARVRAAVPSDAVGVLRLIREHAAFERSVASLSLDDLEAVLSAGDPRTHLLVAEGDGALVGYAAVTFDFSLWRGRRYGHLDCLFVAAAARARGHGKLLFAAAVKRVQAEGVDHLEWQTPVWNEAALRFYRRTGALGLTKERFAMALR